MTTPATARLTSRVEHGTDLVLERVFRAPRALVFEAFSRAEHLRQWWGPRGWELLVCDLDFREGGRWHYCMKCADPAQGDFYGMESWGLALYREIEAPTRIVYTDHFSDAEGRVNDALPATLVTLTFEEVEGGGTKVVNRAAYVSEDALKTVMDMGMLQTLALRSFDALQDYLFRSVRSHRHDHAEGLQEGSAFLEAA